MKILHVSYIYPPEANVADGITTVVHNVTKELARRGHDVTVIASDLLDLNGNRTIKSGHYFINGVSVYYLKSHFSSKTFIITPKIFAFLFNNISNYDLIHIHDCRSFQGIIAFIFAKYKKIPYVFQPHGSFFSESKIGLFKKITKIAMDVLISNKLMLNASRIIALSQTELEQYFTIGLSREKLIVIPNGLNLSEYIPLPKKGLFRKKLGLTKKVTLLLYVGRIHQSKGINLLIKAFAYLIKEIKYTDILLVIAGPDDGYLQEAKSIADSLDISNLIRFTGYLDKNDKLNALIDSDLFITPNFRGLPMTFLETCAVGTPIVTTTSGDKLDWLHGEVGLVTRPLYSELSRTIYFLLSNAALVNEFSSNCKKIVKSTFSLNKTVEKLEKLYEQVIA